MWRAIRVWQRDLKVWSKYSMVSLVSNLGEPILYIMAIGLGVGRHIGNMEEVSYLQFLAPAILAASVMNAASFETTFSSYTRMAVQKTYDGIIVTPVSVHEVILGEILWGATKSLLTGLCIFIILTGFGLIVDPVRALAVFPVIALTGLVFASFGMVMTSFARSYDFFAYYFTLILGPMFFFSGTFFPLSELPKWVGNLAWFLPLSHSVKLCRAMALDRMTFGLWVDVVWLILAAFLLMTLATRRMAKRLVI